MNQSETQSDVGTLDDLISAREAAKVLGVSPEYVARICRSGHVRGCKFGGAWQIERTSIVPFVRERERRRTKRSRQLSEPRHAYRGHRMNGGLSRPPGSGFVTAPFLVVGAVLLSMSAIAFIGTGTLAEHSASNQETHETSASSDDPQVASAAATLEMPTSTTWYQVPSVGSSESAALALVTEEQSAKEVHQSEPAASDPPQPALTNAANAGQLQVSASWLTEQLNSLRAELLASVSQMTTPALTFSGPPQTTPASVQMVAHSSRIDQLTGTSLSNVSVNGISGLTAADIPTDIVAGNYLPLAGGALTGALTGTDLTLSGNLTADTLSVAGIASGGAVVAPYFTATSTTATSTFAGGINVDGGGLIYDWQTGHVGVGTTSPFKPFSVQGDTYIKGGLTINGNASITEGGALSAGDKIISEGEIGLGTSTPFAKLSVQNTLADQTAMAIVGHEAQSAPLLDIWNNPTSNTSLFRITSAGNVGIGSTTPGSTLTVAGTGRFTDDLALDRQLLFSFGVAIGGGAPHPDITDPETQIAIGNGAMTGNIGAGGEGHIAIGKGATTVVDSVGNRPGLIAIGLHASVLGLESMALGYGATASANRALAIGRNASAGHTDTIAIGRNTSATNAHATAVGTSALAGLRGTALGHSASVTADGSIAIGHLSSAVNTSAIALGREAATTNANQFAIGSASFPISEVIFADAVDFVTTSGDLAFNPSGNVGIGTTSPFAKLSVTGAGTGDGKAFQVADSANTPRFTVRDDGKVGIGTSNPSYPLTVSGDAIVQDGILTLKPSSTGDTLRFDHRDNHASAFPELWSLAFSTPSGDAAFQVRQGGTARLQMRMGSTGGQFTITGNTLRLNATGNPSVNNNWDLGVVTPGAQERFFIGDTSGEARLYMRPDSGAVGIGTNSAPLARLDVRPSAAQTGLLVRGADSQTADIARLEDNAGTALVVFGSSGNVGIGTTSPFAKLSVTGAGTGTGKAFQIADSNNTPRFTVQDNGTVVSRSGILEIQIARNIALTASNGVDRYLILSPDDGFENAGASLSIHGYHTPTNSVTGIIEVNIQVRHNIQAEGSVRTHARAINEPNKTILRKADYNGNRYLVLFFGQGGGSLRHLSVNGAASQNLASHPDFLRVVEGADLENVSNATDNGFHFTDGRLLHGGTASFGTTTTPARFTVQTTGTADIVNLLDADGAEVFTALESGNIGIGTTTPWRKLSVTGTVGFDGLGSAGGFDTLCLTEDLEVVTNVGACDSSSEELKHDIASLSLTGADLISAMRPVSFIYNRDTASTSRYGFIAEELAELDANLIGHFDADGKPRTINTTAILSSVVKAVQELIAEFRQLSAKVSGFAERVVSRELVAKERLCLDDLCITKAELRDLLELRAAAGPASSPSDLHNSAVGPNNAKQTDQQPFDSDQDTSASGSPASSTTANTVWQAVTGTVAKSTSNTTRHDDAATPPATDDQSVSGTSATAPLLANDNVLTTAMKSSTTSTPVTSSGQAATTTVVQ